MSMNGYDSGDPDNERRSGAEPVPVVGAADRGVTEPADGAGEPLRWREPPSQPDVDDDRWFPL